jgi:hypothetical protein
MVEPGRALTEALVKLAERGEIVLSCGNSWYWPQGLREVRSLPEGEEATRLRELLSCDPERAISVVKEGGSSRVDLQACKLGTGRRFTTS